MTEPRLPDPELGPTLAAVEVGPLAALDVPELHDLSARAVDARRATFVAGRRAARMALSRRWGGLPSQVRIEPDPWGRPIVRGAREPTHLSITHAGGWALAAVSDAPLGIDLVEHEALPVSMAEDVFTAQELPAWKRVVSDRALSWCLAFAAKEAALKWLGVGMNVPLLSVWVVPRVLSRSPPFSGTADVGHRHGRVTLPIAVWSPLDGLWCVLLGG